MAGQSALSLLFSITCAFQHLCLTGASWREILSANDQNVSVDLNTLYNCLSKLMRSQPEPLIVWRRGSWQRGGLVWTSLFDSKCTYVRRFDLLSLSETRKQNKPWLLFSLVLEGLCGWNRKVCSGVGLVSFESQEPLACHSDVDPK